VSRAADLIAANAAFYECFEALDLDRMTALWEHSTEVWCVHPGGEVIRGWDRVGRSWAAIFASTDYLQFIVTDVEARLAGGAGVVTCTENILSGTGRDGHLGAAKAVATNVFVATPDGAWRLVAHHGSPVLRSTDPDDQET
jgi:ketosteroid isomerase-like protein